MNNNLIYTLQWKNKQQLIDAITYLKNIKQLTEDYNWILELQENIDNLFNILLDLHINIQRESDKH